MNDFLGYLLNLDEPEERERLEANLRNDPEAVRTLAALQRVIDPLDSDREPLAPPADLAERALARIADHVTGESLTNLPAASGTNEVNGRVSPERWRRIMTVIDRPDGGSSRWRRADFIVLVSIVMVGFTLVLAAIPALWPKHDLHD